LPFVLVALAAAGRTRVLVPACLAMVPFCLLLRCISAWTGSPFALTMAATHLRIDALLAGVAIRGIAQYFPERFAGARQWRGVLILAGILLWLPNLFIDPSTTLIRTVGLSGTLLGAAAFLLAAYHIHAGDFGRLSRCISPLALLVAWIGVYSYGIYLWHVTAIGILGREFGRRVLAWGDSTTPLVWLVSVMVIGSGAVVAGVVASKVVEWPVLRLRDRFFPSRSGSLPSVETKGQTNDTASLTEPTETQSSLRLSQSSQRGIAATK
jgi:peptidoglycan/LPS O-acetylase OafA/YrhL